MTTKVRVDNQICGLVGYSHPQNRRSDYKCVANRMNRVISPRYESWASYKIEIKSNTN